jgi:hypothetical protein
MEPNPFFCQHSSYRGKSLEKILELLRNFQNNCPKFSIAQWAKIRPIWDRCYDFKNIFAEKFGEKNGVFLLKKAKLCNNWIIALVF